MPRGSRFWHEVSDRFELGPDESELLAEICATLDTIDRLAGDPSVAAARELRMQRAELRHLVAALGLPDGAGKSVPSGNTQRAKRAANARWKTRGN